MVEFDDRDKEFYPLFEKLISEISKDNDEMDIFMFKKWLGELALCLRLCKGVTRIYSSPLEEKMGGGDTISSFDLGIGGKPVHTVRQETSLMSIATMTVYMAEDEPPLEEREFKRLDMVMRAAISAITRRRLQGIAHKLAFYDDQGYRNVRSFFRYLLWRDKPDTFGGMSAINYNLRHFSLINDKLGRQGGDAVMLKHYQQVEKLVGEKGMVVRLGGDSFVAMCEGKHLDELLEYLTLARIDCGDGKSVEISTCAGIFNIPEGYAVRNPNDIMGKIIYAYRIAQTGGHDHIVFHNEALIQGKEQAMKIQQQFPEALRNKEFHVFFQPKVDTQTGEICGAEALCRWFKDGKIIPPMEFIPVLEQTSEICRLDFYVLDMVCAYLRKWLDEGRTVVRTSVNFSRKHMINDRLLDSILEIVDKHNVPHEFIEIELTETTTDVEFRDLQRIVSGLQEKHIYTSVDDFGMGYSSLNLIRVIPWNVLKVDRSFLPTDEESTDSVRNIMFRNVVAMAREMGLETIAEGVETQAQLEILRQNKCELAQGFLFDKPLPVEEFEKRLDMKRYDLVKM